MDPHDPLYMQKNETILMSLAHRLRAFIFGSGEPGSVPVCGFPLLDSDHNVASNVPRYQLYGGKPWTILKINRGFSDTVHVKEDRSYYINAQ